MWFLTPNSITHLDPAHAHKDTIAALKHLEAFIFARVDRGGFFASRPTRLLPQQRRLHALCPCLSEQHQPSSDGPVEEGGKRTTIAFVVNNEELVVMDSIDDGQLKLRAMAGQ
jgi:hypothetical protein